ncbi:hypothetical protein AGMMS49982_09330 [Bacteroidia bacterium]|nr:hypothetical protein AGMMS49982_09330 [Bacteroidia bacterium]
MNTNNTIIMPILGFVAVTSLLDLQQKCMRDGDGFDFYSNAVASQCLSCCDGCIALNPQENDSDNTNEYRV